MLTIINLFVCFATPLVLSLILTPMMIKVAERTGVLDKPDERKIHSHPMPRLGGVGIFTSFVLSLLLLKLSSSFLPSTAWNDTQQGILLIASLLMVFIVGFWDDVRSLRPGQKFIVQVIAATVVYAAGVRVSAISNVFGSGLIEMGFFDYPVTILWIVGVTNAFNLIDGLDGLASGVAIIAAATIFAISCISGQLGIAAIALLIAGSVLGFLRYNFNPARIFLGDSGSLFLGFSLAVLSIQSSTKGSTAFTIAVPILALGLPIVDTLLSMVRRFLKSLLPIPKASGTFLQRIHLIVMPDKGHIHHRLIAKGFTHRHAVLMLYVVSCAFGIAAFGMQISNSRTDSFIIGAIAIATFVGVRTLQYREMEVLRNGMLLPLYNSALFQRSAFQGLLDLAFIVAAYVGSFALTHPEETGFLLDKQFILTTILVSVIQLAVFVGLGLYKETVRLIGIGDLVSMVRTVAVSVAGSGIVCSLLPGASIPFAFTSLVLDFYILLSLVAGTRISFHVLNYLFHRQTNGGKRVLIYGAGTNSMLTLQKILNDEALAFVPLGFLDDDPHLEGKQINGYSVFGGHWKLEGLIHRMKVDGLLLASDGIKPEILKRLYAVAKANGVFIRRSKIRFEQLPASQKRRNVRSIFAYAGR
jgi:UDP-GlcNAc:undecaprenyl-phosphate GlcNAc-1-phosphate transferase